MLIPFHSRVDFFVDKARTYPPWRNGFSINEKNGKSFGILPCAAGAAAQRNVSENSRFSGRFNGFRKSDAEMFRKNLTQPAVTAGRELLTDDFSIRPLDLEHSPDNTVFTCLVENAAASFPCGEIDHK